MAETKKKRTKKIRFAEAYVLNGYDVTAAAREAGYKGRAYAYTLLDDPEVQEHIAWVEEMRAQQTLNLRRSIDAGAAEAYRDLLVQKRRLLEFLENNPGTHWAERLLANINTYLIDKAVPNPAQKLEHSGPQGGPIEVKRYDQFSDDELDQLIAEKIAALGKAEVTDPD